MLSQKLLLIGVFVLLSFLVYTQSQETWRSSSPEEQGMSSRTIQTK